MTVGLCIRNAMKGQVKMLFQVMRMRYVFDEHVHTRKLKPACLAFA